jgi:hypothetical protein
VQGLKEKYDREVMEEEDEKAMGREFTTRLGPFVEVRTTGILTSRQHSLIENNITHRTKLHCHGKRYVWLLRRISLSSPKRRKAIFTT